MLRRLWPSYYGVQSLKLFEAEARHVIFKNSVHTSEKTQHLSTAKIKCLTMFREIIGVYSENIKKSINKNAELPIFKVGGTYS